MTVAPPRHSKPRKPAAANRGVSAARAMTAAELLGLAGKHRPPQRWYDETENPLTPEPIPPADPSPAVGEKE